MNQVQPKKKFCQFCKSGKLPTYTDMMTLKRVVNDRGKINPRARSGVCSRHQRRVAREIKRARHLALLPFSVRL